ncbi:aldehyde dehydrogenase family protein [Streptomyces niveus]|uniref:aldehyde dehydrogenase family protein n=1 Tax=Streptomyces niveus TaxID=193462 RepID=UPI0036D2FC12
MVPFNWPLAILAATLPHALISGNTVVIKPPPTTPCACCSGTAAARSPLRRAPCPT